MSNNGVVNFVLLNLFTSHYLNYYFQPKDLVSQARRPFGKQRMLLKHLRCINRAANLYSRRFNGLVLQ
jgi:hypothetical protein